MPKALRVDIRPGLPSKTLAESDSHTHRTLAQPGQVWRTGFIESLKGKNDGECLEVSQLYSLNRARGIIGIQSWETKALQPHSEFGYSTASLYAGQSTP